MTGRKTLIRTTVVIYTKLRGRLCLSSFANLGVYVFFGVVDLLIGVGLGILITLFGANAVWSSVQSKPSWLATIVLFI